MRDASASNSLRLPHLSSCSCVAVTVFLFRVVGFRNMVVGPSLVNMGVLGDRKLEGH